MEFDDDYNPNLKSFKVKQRCVICKKFFINNNNNRIKCVECSPKQEHYKKNKLKALKQEKDNKDEN